MQKKYRLSERKVFESITKQKRFFSKKYVVYSQKNKLRHYRISINAPKSKFKLAVQRNRIKRQIRTFFDQIPDKAVGMDLLVVVKADFASDTYQNNRNDFLQLIRKISHN